MSRVGGLTFPEDPARSGSDTLPVWSAVLDPRVLTGRAVPATVDAANPFDLTLLHPKMVRSASAEHWLFVRHGKPVRLDVISGTLARGPVILRFDITADERLSIQLAALRSFSKPALDPGHADYAQYLLALHAVDARRAGASLRETADLILGPGDWPGDGEYRKSLVRRLIATGEQLVRDGPAAILQRR